MSAVKQDDGVEQRLELLERRLAATMRIVNDNGTRLERLEVDHPRRRPAPARTLDSVAPPVPVRPAIPVRARDLARLDRPGRSRPPRRCGLGGAPDRRHVAPRPPRPHRGGGRDGRHRHRRGVRDACRRGRRLARGLAGPSGRARAPGELGRRGPLPRVGRGHLGVPAGARDRVGDRARPRRPPAGAGAPERSLGGSSGSPA